MSVIDEIAAERRRQIEAEGRTPEHDDEHTDGELHAAARCYLHAAEEREHGTSESVLRRDPPDAWPWDRSWWKPRNQRRDLIRAAALIVAEIERLDRTAQAERSDDVG